MSDRRLLALGALAGLGYAVVEMAGVVVGGASNPVPFDIVPSAAAAARAASTPMPVGVWVGLGMEVFATLLLLAFVVRAAAAVRTADAGGLLARVVLAAGIVNLAVTFASFGFFAARYAGSGHGLDAQSITLLAYLNWGSYFMTWPSMGIFVGAIAVGALRTGAVAGWVAWAGVVAAAAGLVGCVDPFNLGQLAQLLGLVWIAVAGIALAVRRVGATRAAAVAVA